ncbi:MAG: SPOR domain-containing protein [Bacillota bacterium]
MTRRDKRGARRWAVILFVLLIWGGCIIAGFLLAKYLITPMLLSGKKQSSTQPQPATQVQQSQPQSSQAQPSGSSQSSPIQKVSLPSLRVYRVQLGSFSKKENATKLADSVKSKGLSAAVVQLGQSYRVVGAYAATREGAKAGAQLFSRAGFETFVDVTEISARSAATSVDVKVVQAVANECCKFIQEAAARFDESFVSGSGSVRSPSASGVEKALAGLTTDAGADSLVQQLRKLAQSCKEFGAKPGSLPEAMQKFIEMVNQYWFLAATS